MTPKRLGDSVAISVQSINCARDRDMEFQPAAPSVMPVFWNFNRLRHRFAKDPLLKLAVLVNDMLVNPVLDSGLKQVIDLEAK